MLNLNLAIENLINIQNKPEFVTAFLNDYFIVYKNITEMGKKEFQFFYDINFNNSKNNFFFIKKGTNYTNLIQEIKRLDKTSKNNLDNYLLFGVDALNNNDNAYNDIYKHINQIKNITEKFLTNCVQTTSKLKDNLNTNNNKAVLLECIDLIEKFENLNKEGESMLKIHHNRFVTPKSIIKSSKSEELYKDFYNRYMANSNNKVLDLDSDTNPVLKEHLSNKYSRGDFVSQKAFDKYLTLKEQENKEKQLIIKEPLNSESGFQKICTELKGGKTIIDNGVLIVYLEHLIVSLDNNKDFE